MAMKIKVPEGMLTAAWRAVGAEMRECLHEGRSNTPAELHVARIAVEAALLWMIHELGKMKNGTNPTWDEAINRLCAMFVEPEPEVQWIGDLFLFRDQCIPFDLKVEISAAEVNMKIREAYRRGKDSK